MTLKHCVYKGCKNFVSSKDKAVNNFTLFSFPKNPARRQKWIELGHVPEDLADSMYFFCSDHFDKKFLAINNRRTTLVGEALPYPCVEEQAHFDYYLYNMNDTNNTVLRHDTTEDQDLHVESTTMTSEREGNFNEEKFARFLDEQQSDEYIAFTGDENSEAESSICNDKKRKMEKLVTEPTSSKLKIIKTFPLQKRLQNSCEKANVQKVTSIKTISDLVLTKQGSSPDKETDEVKIESDDLVDPLHVTTFIFKGEEYVQMPKEHYIKEKIELIKKLREMENTLKAIKGHISKVIHD